MDKVSKALKKLNPKERKIIKSLLIKIKNNNFQLLDFKRLKGYPNIYRVRKGSVRIIYCVDKNNQVNILAVERRSEKTYKL